MDLEIPGHHFVYQWKYANALADFAFQNKDAIVLGTIYQRVYKADHTFYKKLELLNLVKDYLKDVLEIR